MYMNQMDSIRKRIIVHYVARGERSSFFPPVDLLSERQDFSKGCVYCPSKVRNNKPEEKIFS